MGQTLRIHDIINHSEALGPGRRLVISVQGCSIGCPHCIVPDTHSKEGGADYLTNDILNHISGIKDINGITIIGGEPMEQARPLLELCKEIKRRSNLSIFIYTGHTVKELIKSKNVFQLQLLALSDMVCDGPYMYMLADTDLLWRGSSNQKIYVFSDQCRKEIKELDSHVKIEIESTIDGIKIMGVAPEGFINSLENSIRDCSRQ